MFHKNNKHSKLNNKHSYRFQALAGAIGLSVFTITAFFLFLNKPKGAEAAWWNSGWRYRKRIAVEYTGSTELQNYQVFLNDIDTSTLVTAGKLQADCDDLRFAGADGIQYDYWIESGCNTTTTDIWVEVSTINPPFKEIYMYYGNSSAPIGSNGVNTFSFFDDFSAATLDTNKWSATGSQSITNGELTVSTGSVYTKTPVTATATNYVYEYKAAWAATDPNYSGLSIANVQGTTGSNTAADALVYYMSPASSLVVGAYVSTGSAAGFNVTEAQYTAVANTYYIDGFTVNGTNTTFHHNRTTTNSYAYTWTKAPYLFLGYPLGYNSGTTDITDLTVDWVLVRQYATTSPIVNTPNTEEVSKEPILHLSFDEGYGTTTYNNSGIQAPRDYVAYWKMDETSGTTVYDQTQNNNYGTMTNMEDPADHVVAKMGYGLDFDGTDDYVVTTNATTFGTSGSLSAWFYTTDNAGTNPYTIFEWGSATPSSKAFRLYWYPAANATYGNKIVFNTNPGTNDNLVSTITLPAGSWYHVAATWSSAGKNIYVNGVLVASNLTVCDFSGNTSTFRIGRQYSFWVPNWAYPFYGKIDDAKVYNYALNSDQVRADYISTNGMMINMDETSSWVQGVEGTALDFDGTDDNIMIYQNSDLKPLSFSIGFWINPDTYRIQGLVGHGSITGGWRIFMNSTSGNIEFDSTGEVGNITTGEAPPIGSWSYITATYDSSSNTARIYFNGELRNTVTNVTYTNTFDYLYIANSSSTRLDGKIDEVKYYAYARSTSEIKTDYNSYKDKIGTNVGIGGKNPSQSSTGSDAKPILWYDFNQETGTTINDRSGTGNRGLMVNMDTATDYTEGKYGKAIDFDSSNDYVNVSNESVFEGISGITVSAWVKRTSDSGTTEAIASKFWDGTDRSWRLAIESSGDVPSFLAPTDTQNDNDSAYGTTALAVGRWYYITGTWSSATGIISIYVNGILESTTTQTGSTIRANNSPVWIGRDYYNNSPQNPIHGQIDEVKIYNYVRTIAQIHEDMNGSPVSYWKFDEGYGNTTYDSMGNINGILTNMDADTDWINGKYGKALDFDGSNDYVNLDFPASSTTLGETGTVSFWLNMPSAQTNKGLLGFNGNNPLIYHGASGIQTYNSGVADYSNCQATITYAQYNFITITWDNNVLDIYVNGILGCHDPAWETTFNRTAGSLKIGSYTTGTSNILGQIDEVKIYNYALSADQIKAEYNAPYGNPSFEGTSVRYGTQGPDDPTGSNLGFTMPDPVAYWNFNENTGSTVNDVSNNGNTGTMTNMESTDWTQGQYGKALVFDGSNEYVTVPDSATLDITGSLSISTWIKSTAFTATKVILGKRDVSATEGNYILRTASNAGDELEFFYENTGVWQIYRTNDADLANNTWYNIIVTTDGSSLPKIYKNGILLTGSCVGGTCTVALEADDNAFAIGRSGDLASQYFLGTIDEVKIYNTVLTPTQVAWEYNHGKPIFQMKMDQSEFFDCDGSGAGTATVCESMNGLHGITYGSMADSNWVTGKFGKALYFDGTDDYVNIQTGGVLNATQGTVSVWAKADGTQTTVNYIFSHPRTSDDSRIYLFMGANNYNVSCSLGTGTTIGTYTATQETWHNYVCTWNGISGSFYTDGKLIATTTFNGLTTIQTNAYIGSLNATPTQLFNGDVDELKLYSYARTAEQIKQDFLNGAGQRFGD